MNDHGTVLDPATIRFQRLLPADIETVWAYLTESDKRGQWLASGDMELRVGGGVTLRFLHNQLSSVDEPTPEPFRAYENGVTTQGVITRCEPPRALAYTWGGSPGQPSEVLFELKAQDKGTLLTLTHRKLADRAAMVDVAAGWHAHLRVLSARLEGRQHGPFWSALETLSQDYETHVPGA